MLSYGIGLDIGIASVGWAVVALDNNELPYGIINMGSRIFDAAENPQRRRLPCAAKTGGAQHAPQAAPSQAPERAYTRHARQARYSDAGQP